jgi:hypothetical protein
MSAIATTLQKNTAKVIPNALEVITVDGKSVTNRFQFKSYIQKHWFSSFLSRDNAFKEIEQQWKSSKVDKVENIVLC